MNLAPTTHPQTSPLRTLLLIASQPAFVEQFRAAAGEIAARVVQRATVAEAEPLLHPALADGVVLHATGPGVETIWAIEAIRRRAATLPILVFTDAANWDWAEEAYLRGVQHVLPTPPRPRLLASVLNRAPAEFTLAPAHPVTPTPSLPHSPALPSPATERPLEVMRQFSTILKHSLSANSLLSQFLLLLRDVTAVNRATIFVQHTEPADAATGRASATEFRAACAIGLPADLTGQLRLSTTAGIGSFVLRHARVLRRDSAEAADPQIRREFDLLGAQVAVPVLDRQNVLGVATFDGRVTGEPLSSAELNLIFQLLEEIGLTLRNIGLHDQLAANHGTLANVLRHLNQACLVVARDLHFVHINRAAQRLLFASAKGSDATFADLPQLLGGKLYQVLQTGAGIEPFDHRAEGAAEAALRVTIVPLRGNSGATGAVEAALLVAEDKSLERQLAQLQAESANHKLLKTMADRLAHEIGNALVPVSTYLQLLQKPPKGQDFLASLEGALSDSVTRITRLVNQMRFLARDSVPEVKEFALAPLIKDAWQEAQRHQPGDHPKLDCATPDKPVTVVGDRNALKHALAETMLNALQSGPRNGTVEVRLASTVKSDGAWVDIEIEDSGKGFSAEQARKTPEPFKPGPERVVGVGLGLTVTRRIIESHRGKLELVAAGPEGHGRVRISLPLAQVPASN